MASELNQEINKVLKEKVNPILEQHFGAAEISAIEDDVLYVRMTGACSSCPSAQQTVEDIVAGEILDNVSEIKEVRLDNATSQDLLDVAKKILNKEI